MKFYSRWFGLKTTGKYPLAWYSIPGNTEASIRWGLVPRIH